ncbi:MAG: YdeI/OmpD-associated family protein [Vicinamibacterales bacterium]
MPAAMGHAIYFDSPAAFRRWLEAHHASADELLVGYYKAHTGRPSLTWPESVDEALCVGWIDGIRRRVDDDRYTIRFTPRRKHSIWSLVNIRRVAVLTAEGRMRPSGLRAFEARRADRSGAYSFERPAPAVLAAADERRFKTYRKAWAFFQSQPDGYRKTAMHWVTGAKKAETREKRLATLIADSDAGLRIAQLRRS